VTYADLQGQVQGMTRREVDEGLPGGALRLLQMAPLKRLVLTNMDLPPQMTSTQQLGRVKVSCT